MKSEDENDISNRKNEKTREGEREIEVERES